MDNSLHYLALNRQVSLRYEMDVVSNNMANINTAGYRREGVTFTEFVLSATDEQSVSMADFGARYALERPGEVSETNGTFDFAIEGDGYFQLQGLEGIILTRSGSFQISQEGVIANAAGLPLLDTAGAEIPVGIENKNISVANDGTVSADGVPIAQIAVVEADQVDLKRFGDTAYSVLDADLNQVAIPAVRQGAIEGSNVNPVHEIARMIEVTRAYEMAQAVIQDEDERVRETVRTLGERT